LFNTKGEVVGINSRISSEPGRRSYAGLSFAIPAEVVKDVMQQLKTNGQVSRGWLGVMIQDVTPNLSRSFGLDRPHGALVAKVIEDSPALRGGVEVGDIILKFNNHQVETSSELPPLVGSLRAGEVVRLAIVREGKHKELRIKIGELPEEVLTGSATKKRDKVTPIDRLGLKLRELDETSKKESGVDHGVIVAAVTDGPAEEIGLRSDDIIQMIDNQKVEDIAGLQKIIAGIQSGRSVAILVLREAGPVFLAMRMP
jgi:serine protease Do